MKSITQLIHAILFTTGETWTFQELAQSLQCSQEEIEHAVHKLTEILQDQAIILLTHNNNVTLVTHPELKEELKKREKEEISKEFSKGAIETLALIAYQGPIGKSDIDYLRGVNSQFMLRNLILRGMIERVSGSKNSGYVLTSDTLRFLGITNIQDLPKFQDIQEEIKKRIPMENNPQNTLEIENSPIEQAT